MLTEISSRSGDVRYLVWDILCCVASSFEAIWVKGGLVFEQYEGEPGEFSGDDDGSLGFRQATRL